MPSHPIHVHGLGRLKDKDTGKGPTSDSTWEKNFTRLKVYKEKYGNTHVPTRGYDDPQLAKWVSRQREYYNKNVLSSERVVKLNSLGFSWKLKAGGPKRRRSSNGSKNNDDDSGKDKAAKVMSYPKTEPPIVNSFLHGHDDENNKGSESEVAALLTNLRRTSSQT